MDWDDYNLAQLDPFHSKLIGKGLDCLDVGDHDGAAKILDPMVEQGIGAGIYYSARFSRPGETTAEFERRHIQQLKTAAELNYPPALIALGICYDVGDPVVARDPVKAAKFFKKAAYLEHPHGQWIHGVDLLLGNNDFQKNEPEGIEFIRKAAKANFANAIDNLIEFHTKGKFGLDNDAQQVSFWKSIRESNDLLQA